MVGKDLYRQVIMDHFKNPCNKVEEDQEGYISRPALNPSCGDQVVIYIKFDENDIVEDLKFQGTGCSICCASASVMTNELMGLSKDEVVAKVDKFYGIIKDADEEFLEEFEDGQAFTGIKDFPARFKCAFLSWDTVKKIIEES